MADPYPPPHLPPPRHRWGRFVAVFAAIAVVVAAGAWGLAQLAKPDRPREPERPAFVVPILTPAPGSAIPGPAGAVPGPTAAPEPYEAWLTRIASTTDIPSRVLRSYAHAASKAPSRCHLTWATLAGVGRIESQHGQHGGSVIRDDGTETPPVVGIPLDGSPGVQAVPDTDHGELDGDTQWDRALGPLQLLPATWRKYGVRASGDGKQPDPQNIDDAALTSARFLCARGGDLGSPQGWWNAVLAYNNSTEYAQEVFSNADAYGKANVLPK